MNTKGGVFHAIEALESMNSNKDSFILLVTNETGNIKSVKLMSQIKSNDLSQIIANLELLKIKLLTKMKAVGFESE